MSSPKISKYKLLIAYEGTRFGGWQVQPNATTVQELIQKALSTALRTPTALTGAGRTDAGVHALGQTAHFVFLGPLDLPRLLASLNGLLPPDIRIRAISPVPENFHARYSAKSKVYHYYLHLDPVQNPFCLRYSYHVPHPIDRAVLTEAATHFVGTHDFTSFTHRAQKDAVRTLYRLDVVPEEGGLRLEFEGEGFLYKMVRNIVGTLLDIGGGKIPLSALPSIFAAKERCRAGRTAPPQGLFLIQVKYAPEPKPFQEEEEEEKEEEAVF